MEPTTEVLRYAAFTTTHDGGNPAGVVLDATRLDDARMQAIAADIGYAEMVFVTEATVDGDFRRHTATRARHPAARRRPWGWTIWFTATEEVRSRCAGCTFTCCANSPSTADTQTSCASRSSTADYTLHNLTTLAPVPAGEGTAAASAGVVLSA